MVTVYFNNDTVLARAGKIAISSDCCCGCCCKDGVIDYAIKYKNECLDAGGTWAACPTLPACVCDCDWQNSFTVHGESPAQWFSVTDIPEYEEGFACANDCAAATLLDAPNPVAFYTKIAVYWAAVYKCENGTRTLEIIVTMSPTNIDGTSKCQNFEKRWLYVFPAGPESAGNCPDDPSPAPVINEYFTDFNANFCHGGASVQDWENIFGLALMQYFDDPEVDMQCTPPVVECEA